MLERFWLLSELTGTNFDTFTQKVNKQLAISTDFHSFPEA